MRISIRRCLSMLRNTSNGNELAVPLPMPKEEHSVGYLVSCIGCVRTAWVTRHCCLLYAPRSQYASNLHRRHWIKPKHVNVDGTSHTHETTSATLNSKVN